VGLDGLHFEVSKGFGSPGIQEWRFWWHHPGGKSLKFCQSKLTPALHMVELLIGLGAFVCLMNKGTAN
jgi:hypothetical protein